MSKHLIEFIDVSKSYDSNLVLDKLNLYIRENEFLTLLGPSGCGKTTTLRLLGGFETPDEGKIMFDGADITGLAANERNLNTVFQKYSLFHANDHRTRIQNKHTLIDYIYLNIFLKSDLKFLVLLQIKSQ